MRMFKKEEGFTLVELMVVVLIIGILVAVAVPVFNAASDNARKKSCFANQRTIDGALQQYLADNEDLVNTDISAGTIDALTVPAGSPTTLVPDYIATVITCPSDTAYDYTILNGAVEACTSAGDHGTYQD